MNTSAFLIASLIIILIPGTGVIYTVSLGMSKGRKKAFFAALGCTAGILPHLCVSIVLSSLLMQMDDKVFLAAKYIGVLYLIYLGVGMIFSKGNVQFAESKAHAILLFISAAICKLRQLELHDKKLFTWASVYGVDLYRVYRIRLPGRDSKGMALSIAQKNVFPPEMLRNHIHCLCHQISFVTLKKKHIDGRRKKKGV